MSRLREAAQQALEALERGETKLRYAAITALKAALAESEPKTAWAHLPNAVHIDRILAHAKEHPDKWEAAWDPARATARDAVWEAALAAARAAARVAVWEAALAAARAADRVAAWVAARVAARVAAWDATVALIAWDYAGELLSQPIEAVKARADEGECAAVLIYPAMVAMKEDK